MILRPERPEDAARIREITYAAFATRSWSDGAEGGLPDALRADGHLSLSLVAEEDGEVVGQVCLSPAQVGGQDNWYGLGPIAVTPERFHQGIGGALVQGAVDWAKSQGAAGIVLTGSSDYYPRFGFESGAVSYLTTPEQYTMRLVLHGPPAHGEIVFARALQEAG